MQLMEDENVKLFEDTKYFKKENKEASKHLREMDGINQQKIQDLTNQIVSKDKVISSLKKELRKYTIPKYTPTADIVTPGGGPSATVGAASHQVLQQEALQQQLAPQEVAP